MYAVFFFVSVCVCPPPKWNPFAFEYWFHWAFAKKVTVHFSDPSSRFNPVANSWEETRVLSHLKEPCYSRFEEDLRPQTPEPFFIDWSKVLSSSISGSPGLQLPVIPNPKAMRGHGDHQVTYLLQGFVSKNRDSDHLTIGIVTIIEGELVSPSSIHLVCFWSRRMKSQLSLGCQPVLQPLPSQPVQQPDFLVKHLMLNGGSD